MDIGEIMERAIGPLFFASAVASFITIYNLQADEITSAKELYTSDATYTQQQSLVTEQATISRAELQAIILSEPSTSMRIEIGTQRLIMVEVLNTGAMQVTVLENPYLDQATTSFSETLQNYQGFPAEYLLAKEYTVSYAYNEQKELSKVIYTGVTSNE